MIKGKTSRAITLALLLAPTYGALGCSTTEEDGCVGDDCVECLSDADCGANEICEDDTNLCIPHILSSVEVNPNPVRKGDSVRNSDYVTATITISNPGPNTETIDVSMTIPQGLERLLAANRSGGACDAACDGGDVIRWTVEDLEPGRSELLWIRTYPLPGGVNELPDDTQITFAAVADTVLGFQGRASGNTIVRDQLSLNLRVEESSNPVTAGQELTYTIHYANQGADPLDPVILTFTVPEGATHDEGETVTMNLGPLASGVGGTVAVTVTIDDPLAAGSQLRALTEITEQGSPETTSSAVTQTPVSQTPLTASVEVMPLAAAPGTTLAVDVTVQNTGGDAETLDLALTLPLAMSRVLEANRSGGTCDVSCEGGDVIRWTIDPLTAGESTTRSIRSEINVGGVNSRPDGFLISYDSYVRATGEVPVRAGNTSRIESP